ncbi:LytTR family transcriptional regulator [Enterococcus faecium]|nr:LytTR family transcriptional regulator [Enterococcus faecium]
MKVKFEKKKDLEENFLVLQAKEKTNEIDSIIKDIEHVKTVLNCSNKDKNVLIPCNLFIRFFSCNKKIYGSTIDYEYLVKYRLYELESFLQKNFLRISNNEIINIDYIAKLEVTSVGIIIIYFKNGEQTSSSRRYLKSIKECLL